jgi:hypothetical protein
VTAEPDPQELYRDPAVDGCGHYRDPATCEACAEDERYLKRMRYLATQYVDAANEAMAQLKRLVTLHAELAGNGDYAEFYSDSTDDADALSGIAKAQYAVRAVTRIARERAARTRQDP